MLLIKLSISLLLILLDKTELHVDPHITTGVQPYQLKQSCLIIDLISPSLLQNKYGHCLCNTTKQINK